MSWLISFIITSAVLTSGTILPENQGQSNVIRSSGAAAPVVLDETERFEKTYPFDATGKIEVSNINGSIRIDSWDRNEIKVEYIKVADTKQRLTDLTVKIEAERSRFRIDTDYKKHKGNNKRKWKKGAKLYVDFKLTVPRTARLDGVESVNGSVTVSNMTNYSEVSAVNGSVKATNLRGTAALSTVNGTVFANFPQLDKSSSISLETVNGAVQLSIPSDSNATIKAETVSGGISNEFRLPVRKGKYVGRDLHGRIGNGDVKINLSSVNGRLSIKREKDGKNLRPVTNLLKKRSADEDENDVRVRVDTARRKSKKDRVIAMAAIQKALEETERVIKVETLNRVEADEIRKEALKSAAKAMKEIDVKKLKIDQKKLLETIREAEMERVEALRNISSAKFYGRSPYIAEKTESFEVKGIPTVEIDAEDCAVVVRGWSKQEVKYSVSRVKRRKVSPVVIRSENDKKLRITVKRQSRSALIGKHDQIRLEVFVPKKSNLEIHTHRGLRLEGVSGNIKLKSENGAVDVRDVSGRLNLYAVNKYRNRVRIVGFDGKLTAALGNSDTYLEGNFEKIVAEGKGSRVYLMLDEEADATIKTNNIGAKGKIKPGDTFVIGGINLVREEEGFWRIGEGGPEYTFDLVGGGVFLRTQDSIRGR